MLTMFGKRSLAAGVSVLAALVIIGAAACDGGSDASPFPDASPSPPVEASPDATPTPSNDVPTPGVIEITPTPTIVSVPPAEGTLLGAAFAYIQDPGLSGDPYEPAEPLLCGAFTDEEVIKASAGKVCVDIRSGNFTESDGTINVNVLDSDDVWRLTLELRDRAWVVVGDEKIEG